MKIAILESRTDLFMNDVAGMLTGHEIEFLAFHEFRIPPVTEFSVVVDRLSYLNPFLREILKSLSLSGAYVINNPFVGAVQNKIVDALLCAQLGIMTPKTIVLPCFAEGQELEGIVNEPHWEQIQAEIGFPCVMKPFDGYGWQDVYVLNSLDELKSHYHRMMYTQVMLVQQLINYSEYYRFFCINKREVLPVRWIPRPLGMGEYLYSELKTEIIDKLSEKTIALNSALDLDFNAVEWCLDSEGQAWVIDSFNDVPDVRQEKLPSEYYHWLVNKFAQCVREKAEGNARNRPFFSLQADRNGVNNR